MATRTPFATTPAAVCLSLLLTLGSTAAWSQTRGELLYATHCVACHNDQMHWRDKKQAVDWPSLKAQVQLWQATGLLGWTDDDVQQVARHLNDTYYRFAVPPAPGTANTAQRRSRGMLALAPPARAAQR